MGFFLPLGRGSRGTGCWEVPLHPGRVPSGSVTPGKLWHRCLRWFVLPMSVMAFQLPPAWWGCRCDLVCHGAAAGGSPSSGDQAPALCCLQHKTLCVWDLLCLFLPPEGFKTIIMFSSLCQAEKCTQTWLGCCAPPGASLLIAGSQDPRNLSGSLPEAAGLEKSLPRPPTQGTAQEVVEGVLGLGRVSQPHSWRAGLTRKGVGKTCPVEKCSSFASAAHGDSCLP